jgi:hypothetical protein
MIRKSATMHGHMNVKKKRLCVFENGFMRKTFGTMKAEVIGQWRRTHSEGFRNHQVLLEWSKQEA